MKLALLGGSGRMGQQVIQQALTRGWDVSTLVRHPDKITITHANLTIIQGDATNVQDITTVIQHADVVIHTVSVPLRHHKPTTLYSRVTQAVIDARPQTSAQQYIVMSSTGTDHSRAELHRLLRWGYEWMLGDAADDKELEEQLLSQSSLPWTVIKAVRLMDTDDISYQTMDFAQYHPSLSHKVSRAAVANAICDIASQQSDLLSKTVILSHK